MLYSRVLRDYLLYAAVQGVLEIRWSAAILAEVVAHLTENIAGFDAAAGARVGHGDERRIPGGRSGAGR